MRSEGGTWQRRALSDVPQTSDSSGGLMRLGSRPALINVETQVSHYRLIRRFGAALALVVALYSLAGAAVVFADAPVTLSQGLNWNSAAARD